MLENPEEFGRTLAKRVRDIAATVAGDIYRAAQADLEAAKALHEETRLFSELAQKCLAEADDLPTVLALLQSLDTKTAQQELLALKREEDLARRDTAARETLAVLQAEIVKGQALQAAYDERVADLEKRQQDLTVWQQDSLNALSETAGAMLENTVAATEKVHKLAEDHAAQRSALSAELALSCELWERDVAEAVSKAEEAVALAAAARARLDEERKSMAASKAHVTKALEKFALDADMALAALDVRFSDHIAKMEVPPPPPATDNPHPFVWMGAWQERQPYAPNAIVSFQGSAWIAVRPSTGKAPAAAANSPWNLFAAAGMSGGGGFTNRREALNPEYPTGFVQDTPPDPNPGNWKSSQGGAYHVRTWIRTTDMRMFCNIQDAAGDWVWTSVTGAPTP